MVNGDCRADTLSGAKGTLWEDTVTREEKDRAVDAAIARYEHLGATVVSDDQTLCRLLQTLEFSGADRDVGEYLCSFLTPDDAARARRRWQAGSCGPGDGREEMDLLSGPRGRAAYGGQRASTCSNARARSASPLSAGHRRSSSSASASEILAR